MCHFVTFLIFVNFFILKNLFTCQVNIVTRDIICVMCKANVTAMCQVNIIVMYQFHVSYI